MAALTALQRLIASPKTAKFVETLRHADLPVNWADDPEIVSMAGDAYKELGTGSPFWKATFGNSKVVDDAGDPLELYHGTGRKFNEFKNKKPVNGNSLGPGHYLSPEKSFAESFMPEGKKGYLLETYVNTEKPFTITPDSVREIYDNAFDITNAMRTKDGVPALPESMRNTFMRGMRENYEKSIADGPTMARIATYNELDKLRPMIEAAGYDSIVDGPSVASAKQIVIGNPNAIKSVNNRGTFNPVDPNIYKGLIPLMAAGGAAALAPGEAQASEAQAEWPRMGADGRLVWPADMPGYHNSEPGLEAPLVDPMDIATAPIGMTTAAGKALAMAAEPGLAYGTDKALGALLGMFQREKRSGGGGV
jgi:hypothetical protein